MLSTLPDELLLEIASRVVSQPALAALSQVSKHFYAVFTPFLYRRMWVDANSWTLLDNITDSHILDVRILLIGTLNTIPKDTERRILHSLSRMENLRTLTYVSQSSLLLLTLLKPPTASRGKSYKDTWSATVQANMNCLRKSRILLLEDHGIERTRNPGFMASDPVGISPNSRI